MAGTRSRKNRNALELGSTTGLVKFCPCLKLLFLIFRPTSKNRKSCYLTPRLRDIKQKKIITISIPESQSHFLCFHSTQAKSKVWILIIQNWPVGFRDTFTYGFVLEKAMSFINAGDRRLDAKGLLTGSWIHVPAQLHNIKPIKEPISPQIPILRGHTCPWAITHETWSSLQKGQFTICTSPIINVFSRPQYCITFGLIWAFFSYFSFNVFQHMTNRDLTKLRRRRQQQQENSWSKTTMAVSVQLRGEMSTFYCICLNSDLWNNREKVWKDAKSVFREVLTGVIIVAP